MQQSKALHTDFCLGTVECRPMCLGKMVYHSSREDCMLKKGKSIEIDCIKVNAASIFLDPLF